MWYRIGFIVIRVSPAIGTRDKVRAALRELALEVRRRSAAPGTATRRSGAPFAGPGPAGRRPGDDGRARSGVTDPQSRMVDLCDPGVRVRDGMRGLERDTRAEDVRRHLRAVVVAEGLQGQCIAGGALEEHGHGAGSQEVRQVRPKGADEVRSRSFDVRPDDDRMARERHERCDAVRVQRRTVPPVDPDGDDRVVAHAVAVPAQDRPTVRGPLAAVDRQSGRLPDPAADACRGQPTRRLAAPPRRSGRGSSPSIRARCRSSRRTRHRA